MTEKILKKYTSIPQHLYVNRDADEQLKRIVNEMQRPGYVLVARQMGKTNLLFNAKRSLENNKRLFIYVDLSNVFKRERECYRNIIDTIIEPNERLFESIETKIDELRKKKLPPHQEYSKSLRIVLNDFHGNVVIILDEIDALRSAEYSDNIFAQIRSNYFSRTNFPVFERLTYILSGVIEPTELIKDRNKSPFNIGDKIYLNDFSLSEHNSFIKKSKLVISNEISNEIYNWTKGNPRLTFDICSSIENKLIKNIPVTTDSLNDLIKKKYLTSFDIAPIDHIRELVKSNKIIRKSVLNILQNKDSELNDEVKKKLYLYGIINSKFDEKIEIKNPIIEASLSVKWIKSIDKQSQSLFSFGLDLVNQFDYQEAINILKEFLLNSTPSQKEMDICHYNIGFSYYKIGDFEDAIKYFSKKYIEELYIENSKSLLGICKLSIGDKESAIKILEEVISHKKKNFAFRNAVMNLAPLIREASKFRALELYDELYKSTFDNDDDISNVELDKIRTLAYYYKAEIFFKNKNNLEAIKNLKEALKYSTLLDSLNIKFSIYNLSKEKDNKLKSQIVESIIEQKLTYDSTDSYPFSFSKKHLYNYLDLYFDSENLEQFERLLNYSYNNLFDQSVDIYEIVYNSSNFSSKGMDILKYIISNESNVSDTILLKTNRDLAYKYIGSKVIFFPQFHKYESLFLKSDHIDVDDIYMFARAIKEYSDSNEIQKALKICESIESKLSKVEGDNLKLESYIIYYWFSQLYFGLHKRENAIEYANITIQLLNDFESERTSMIDEKGVKSIIEQMEHIKKSLTVQVPITRERKYGRNEWIKVQYINHKIVKNKYKKLEADILAERCKII